MMVCPYKYLLNHIESVSLQLIEQSGVLEVPGLCYRSMPAVVTSAIGQMVCNLT